MRTIVLTSLGVLALFLAALAMAPDATATPLAAASHQPLAHADNGSSFGYRCAPRVRRVIVRRRYVRPVYSRPVYSSPAYTKTCAPRYVVRRSYYRPSYRPYYYPAVRVGVGFGYGYRHGHRSHYGHRHHGHHGNRHGSRRYVGRRR